MNPNSLRAWCRPPAVSLVFLLAGCATGVAEGNGSTPNQPGIVGGGSAGASSNVGGAGSAGGSPQPLGCIGPDVSASKRIVRLSFNQIANSIGSLISPALGAKIIGDFKLLDAEHRAFPPLQSPREGNSLTDDSWSTVDQIAQSAAKYVTENLAAVTGCGAAPTDECAKQYLNKLAAKAYRRPLIETESAPLADLYTTALKADDGATAKEALEYGVYAILQAPQFLYRTEFGTDWKIDGALTPDEVASMLSFFLTDDAPDAALLTAAAQSKLGTPSEVAAHVERILGTQAAKLNLQGALMSYFAYPNLESQIIQDDAFNGDMRKSMYREAELFLQNTLWTEPLNQLLISRTAYVNATLAPIYGITKFPPLGATLDAEKFARVELPANRTGLLTQAGFLANRSRPDETSVVGRGLLIKNALLCTETPLPPEDLADAINQVTMANADASQRELSGIRTGMSPCNGCHLTFDAYGLALDTFDVLGRYREKDREGRAIDPRVTLPTQVGGGDAKDIIDVAQKLSASGAFTKCMSQNLINYALADVSAGAATISSCAVARVAEDFNASNKTFASLIKAVATSAAFSSRSKGVDQ